MEQGWLELPYMLGTISECPIAWKNGSHGPSCQGGEEALGWGVGSISWDNLPSPALPSGHFHSPTPVSSQQPDS